MATKDVNITRCQESGTDVVEELNGKAAFTICSKTLALTSAVKASGKRLLVVSQSGDNSDNEVPRHQRNTMSYTQCSPHYS